MEDVSPWFNEGLAEYYEAADISSSGVKTGRVVADHVKRLRLDGTVPLTRFLRMDQEAFMADPLRHYAQAWAFVHYLRHGGADCEIQFQRFWDCFKRYPGRAIAVEQALEGVDVPALDRRFQAWIFDR
jgi:hypothetical protein